MSELKLFCYNTCRRLMAGLAQELKIWPTVHYRPSGHNAARVLSLRLEDLNPHYLPKIRSLRDPLTMWAGLSDRTPVRIGQNGQAVIIEIPKPGRFWAKVTIEQLEQRQYLRSGPIATLGLDLQDDPKRLNFTDPAIAHVLISGQTRSGKTNTEKVVAWNLARNTDPADCKLLIFDVAKRGFNWADFDPATGASTGSGQAVAHLLHPLITDLIEADRALCWLDQELTRRAEQRRTRPRLFVLIDELKALADDSRVATGYLARLASTGGEFGVHLILSTQYPQIQLLGSAELKRNLPPRLCGRVDAADAAANALGVPDSGAELLQGYGDFLLRDRAGLARLTVAKLEPTHVETLPRAEIRPLNLPDPAVVNAGPRPARQPDPLQPEQVALALFKPAGINKLASELGIGSTKAKRIKQFAAGIRAWANEHGYTCLEA